MTTPKSKRIGSRELLIESSFYLSFLLFLFVPVFLGDLVVEPTNIPRFLVTALILFILLFGWWKRKELLLPTRDLSILLLFFCIWSYCSIFWSINKAEAVYESQKLFLHLLLMIFFLNALQEEKNRLLLYRSITFTTLGLLLFSMTERFLGEEFPSLLFHPNLLSSFLYLLLIPVLLLFREGKKWEKMLSFLTVVLTIYWMVELQSRAVWIALFIAVSAFFLLSWCRNKRKMVQVLTATLFVTLFLGGTIAGHLVVGTKKELVNESTSSLQERQLLWEKSVYLLVDNPMTGVGVGNWQSEYSKYGVGDIDKTRFYNVLFKRPHNDFLWIASELGVPGILCVLGIVFLLGVSAMKHLLTAQNVRLQIIFSGLIGFLFIASYSFPKERMAHLLIASFLLAAFIYELKKSVSVGKSIRWIFLGISFTTLLFGLLVGGSRFYGEYRTLQLLEAKEQNRPDDMILFGENSLSPFYNIDPRMTPIQSYLGEAYLLKGEKEQMLKASEEAYRLMPYQYKTVVNYGYALMWNFQLHKAEKVLLEAHRINPFYEPTLLNLSVLFFNRGNYEESLNWLSKIPNYQLKYPTNHERLQEALESAK